MPASNKSLLASMIRVQAQAFDVGIEAMKLEHYPGKAAAIAEAMIWKSRSLTEIRP